MQKRFLIVDDMHQSICVLLAEAGIEAHYEPHISRPELLKIIKNYEGLLIRSKTDVDRELIDAATNLEVIGRAGAGLDKIDVQYVESKGIEILNAPEGNRDALAEHAMGLLLSMLNNIVKADAEVRNWIWDREGNRGDELSDKTIGIIGFGTKNVEEVSLSKLYDKADILSLHVPLNEETRAWIDKEFIMNFRKNIYLLNTARGEILPTKDLLDLLDSGKVKGAALDVLDKEKFDKLTEEERNQFMDLFSRKNIVFSPHVGGWTFASYKRINEVLVGKIASHYHIEKEG